MQKQTTKRPFPFSIENLLGVDAPPPSKRLTRHRIADILKPSDYVKKLDEDKEWNNKFKFGKLKSSFTITDLPDDPESILAGE